MENDNGELVKKWSQYGLLKSIVGKFNRSNAAALLENQRLFNETFTDSGDNAQFKRISIPMVVRIAGWWGLKDLVSVQSAIGPTSIGYYDNGGKTKSISMASKGVKLKTTMTQEFRQDIRSHFNLDREAEAVAIVSVGVANELDRTVLDALKAVAPSKTELGAVRTSEVMTHVVDAVNGCVVKPTWMVVSEDVAVAMFNQEVSGSYIVGIQSIGSRVVGDLELKVLVDRATSGDVLLGKYDSGIAGTGAIFAPYVLLASQRSASANPFEEVYEFYSRYDFQVVDNQFYTHVKFKEIVAS